MNQLRYAIASSRSGLNFFKRKPTAGYKVGLLMFCFAFSLNTHAQIRDGQQPYQMMDLSKEGVKAVEVETSGGSIAVSGTNENLRLEMYVSRNNERSGNALTNDEIKTKLAADYDLTLNVSNGRLIAKVRPKRNNMDWKQALHVSFRIFVPQATSTQLTTSGGGISLNNLSATQNFATSGGNLDLERLSGKVRGRTSGGGIRISDSKDDIDLATSGGNIQATNCTGNLRLATSGGSFELSNLSGDIKASTSGGDVRGSDIDGELVATTSGGSINLKDLHCSVEAATSGGHIDLALTRLGSYVRVSNSGGDINLRLPAGKGLDLDLRGDKIKTATLKDFSGSNIEDEKIEGKLNGGGVPVTVRAGSGKIDLSFQ